MRLPALLRGRVPAPAPRSPARVRPRTLSAPVVRARRSASKMQNSLTPSLVARNQNFKTASPKNTSPRRVGVAPCHLATRVFSALCVATAGFAGGSGPARWPPRLPPLPSPGLAWRSTLPRLSSWPVGLAATATALARLGVAVAILARTFGAGCAVGWLAGCPLVRPGSRLQLACSPEASPPAAPVDVARRGGCRRPVSRRSSSASPSARRWGCRRAHPLPARRGDCGRARRPGRQQPVPRPSLRWRVP